MAKPTGRSTLSGAELIAAERERQVSEEDWDAQHDDGHDNGILAIAAAELAVDGTDAYVAHPYEYDHCGSLAKHGYRGTRPNPIRALTIAGALIAAEIDRLQRLHPDERWWPEVPEEGEKQP